MDAELRGSLACLFECRDSEVLIEGRAGTSKTTGTLVKILYRCEAFPGSRHLLVRQTRASLTDSVLVTLERMMNEAGGVLQAEANRVGREQRHAYHLFGSEIVCGGLDKPEKMFSTEWDTVYLAEATEVKTIDPWDLFGRAMRHNKCDYHQRIMDCNPGAPGLWINRRASYCPDWLRDCWKTREDYKTLQVYNWHQQLTEQRPMRRLVSVHPDNPGYWNKDEWTWTPFGEHYVNTTLAKMTGHRRARMFDGRWKAADNVVYPEYDEQNHWVPVPHEFTFVPEHLNEQGEKVDAHYMIPPDWQVVVGIDPGFDHPTAILWFATKRDGSSPVYIVDEVYRGGVGVKHHGDAIHKRNRDRTVDRYYADPQHAFSCTAQSPKSIAMQYREQSGLTLTPWPRTGGNEETMVESVREVLRDRKLLVCHTCPATQMEFQTWSYFRDQKGNMKGGEDKFEDANNHAMDVVKGVMATGFGRPRGKIVVYG